MHDDTSLKTLHMKRLQVHSTQELQAAPQIRTTPPVVSSSAAAASSGGTGSSPAFGGVVPLSSSGSSGSAGFCSRSTSTAPFSFGSEKFAALSPLLPQNAAVPATSSGNSQFSPTLRDFTATKTEFAEPALPSFGFGSTSGSLFGSSSSAAPFSGLSFPFVASAASSNSSAPSLGTGIGSAAFGSSSVFSFPAPSPLAFVTPAPAHATPPAIKQPQLALSSTPSLQHQPVAQASTHRAAAQDSEDAATSAPQSGQRKTHEDAVEYLERVRATFAERPFIYNSFLAMFREFKSEKINTQQVIDRVKLLFKGHPDLIDGFNMFLPASYRIKVDRTEASSPSENTTAKPFSAAYEPCTSRSLL